MKYGPIICDPTSEEAKKLVGKKVVCEDLYKAIEDPDKANLGIHTLKRIDGERMCPFIVDELGTKVVTGTFIREVIEEKPQYRPYNDTDEMVKDFCKRFGIVKNDWSLPSIWMKGKVSGHRLLVEGYSDDMVFISYAGRFYLSELFDNFTYLDGSPVGKEVTE